MEEPIIPIQSATPAAHNLLLDALRGIAALLVLLSHWRNLFFLDYHQLAHPSPLLKAAYFASSLGHEAVVVFFVLSGYLVGGSVLRSHQQGRWSWPTYLTARLTRLYIVLIPALILGGLLDRAGMSLPGTESLYSGQSGIDTLKANIHQTLTLPAFAGNLLYLQDLKGWAQLFQIPTFGSNGPLWSLSLEFWCYLAFPALLLALGKSLRWPVRIAYAAAFAACATAVGLSNLTLCATWFLGVLLVYLPPLRLRNAWQRRAAIAAAFSLFLGTLILEKSLTLPLTLVEFPLGLAVTLSLWTLLHQTTRRMPAAFARLSSHSARSAYTLYLVHLPALVFLKACLHLPQSYPNWSALLAPTAVLLAVLLYSQAAYACFERQTGRLRNWLSRAPTHGE